PKKCYTSLFKVTLFATPLILSMSLEFAITWSLPQATLFPYTTLFRSRPGQPGRARYGRGAQCARGPRPGGRIAAPAETVTRARPDRKSTRLNSSHVKISYAVFCLKKKNRIYKTGESILHRIILVGSGI